MLRKRLCSKLLLIVILIILVILNGCAGKGPATASAKNKLNSTDDLITKLKAKGHKVELTMEEAHQPFFSVSPKLIKVEGETVQVFEYKNKSSADKEVKKISRQGDHIGNAIVDWIDKPNFYNKDNLIVLYVGRNADTLKALDDILGASVTD